MIYIKLEQNMDLVVTKNAFLHRGDNLNRHIVMIFPRNVGKIDVASSTVRMTYLKQDETMHIVELTRSAQDYNDKYLQYEFDVTEDMTEYVGDLFLWVQFTGAVGDEEYASRTGICKLHIHGKNVQVAPVETVVVVNVMINDNKEMILQYSDGSIKSLGKVGKGEVYVPHIDGNKILSYTVEDDPDGVPDPVNLNPEWQE